MILDMVARLPELTEVDGSMTPLEELDDSTKRTRKKGWRWAGFWLYCVLFLQYPRAYIYTLVLARVLLDYDYK
jgi:hypothetical protein